MNRRKFLKVVIGAGAAVAAVGFGAYVIPMLKPEPSPPNIAYCGENCVPEICGDLAAGACDGCQASIDPDSKLSDYCLNECDVRPCAQERGFETCADCEEYPCMTLTGLWGMFEGGRKKAALDEIREKKSV